MSRVRIENVTKSFGTFDALKDISLEIPEGKLTCFLGPSGSGKSTLLRIIAGLECQSRGKVWFGNTDISRWPASQRDAGIVFQSYALFPNLTVSKNIAYGLVNKKLPRAEINLRVMELLKLVHLETHGEKLPSQLSGGEQQRVALARALALKPGVLLLDEPLSALDARVRGHLRHEIKNLQRRMGITTVMVTHDQEEALTMADRIVVLNRGHIEQVGTPQEIYQNPASAFVANFLGKMNFLPGVLIEPNRVRLEHQELWCNPTPLATGSAVKVALRPEQIELCQNGLEGVVEELEYFGSHYSAGLCIGQNKTRIEVHVPLTHMTSARIKIGSSLRLGYSGTAHVFSI